MHTTIIIDSDVNGRGGGVWAAKGCSNVSTDFSKLHENINLIEIK